jgi:hypothetical protein
VPSRGALRSPWSVNANHPLLAGESRKSGLAKALPRSSYRPGVAPKTLRQSRTKRSRWSHRPRTVPSSSH